MQSELSSIHQDVELVSNTASCTPIRAMFQHAVTSFCDDGVIGSFSLWVHQMALCILLMVCVICTASVWERAEARDARIDRQYQLLGSYEEDNVEHIYMTPE